MSKNFIETDNMEQMRLLIISHPNEIIHGYFHICLYRFQEKNLLKERKKNLLRLVIKKKKKFRLLKLFTGKHEFVWWRVGRGRF